MTPTDVPGLVDLRALHDALLERRARNALALLQHPSLTGRPRLAVRLAVRTLRRTP